MKVAMLLPSLANSGPNIVAKDIIDELYAEIDFTVFYFNTHDGLKFPVPTNRVGFRDVNRMSNFDLVHSHELRPNLFAGMWARRLRKLGITTLSTMHAYLSEALQFNYGRVAQSIVTPLWHGALRRQDFVATLSNRMLDHYHSVGIDSKRMRVISNGRGPLAGVGSMPDDDQRQIDRLKSKYVLLGGIGRLESVKGFDQLIRCLAVRKDCALLLVGDGSERESLQSLAAELGVSDRVLMLGYRPDASVYFNAIDVYMMVSHHEGFPLVLIEAAMHARPTVCCRLDTMTEFFTESEVSYYTPNNLESLNEGISAALSQRETLGRAICSRYSRDYTRSVMAQHYLVLYKQLLS